MVRDITILFDTYIQIEEGILEALMMNENLSARSEECRAQDASKVANNEDWNILLQEEEQEVCRDQDASKYKDWDILLHEEEQEESGDQDAWKVADN